MKAVRGYALFKGEKGYQFAVSLGKEGMPTKVPRITLVFFAGRAYIAGKWALDDSQILFRKTPEEFFAQSFNN